MSLYLKRGLHSKCIGSRVTIKRHTDARGPGACSPRESFDKNGAIWCNLGVPKNVITILKIINFKVTKSTRTELNCHIFLSDQRRCVLYMKMIIFIFRTEKGGLGEAEENFKNQTKWKLFLYFFFAFWQGSLDPQNYDLAPQLP